MILMITCHSKWCLLLILMNYIGNTKHQQTTSTTDSGKKQFLKMAVLCHFYSIALAASVLSS